MRLSVRLYFGLNGRSSRPESCRSPMTAYTDIEGGFCLAFIVDSVR